MIYIYTHMHICIYVYILYKTHVPLGSPHLMLFVWCHPYGADLPVVRRNKPAQLLASAAPPSWQLRSDDELILPNHLNHILCVCVDIHCMCTYILTQSLDMYIYIYAYIP